MITMKRIKILVAVLLTVTMFLSAVPMSAVEEVVTIDVPIAVDVTNATGIDLNIRLNNNFVTFATIFSTADCLSDAVCIDNIESDKLKVAIASATPITCNGEMFVLRLTLTKQPSDITELCKVMQVKVNEQITYQADNAILIDGVTDGATYRHDVTISFNEGSAMLNGEPFISGSTVSDINDYTLIIIDQNEKKRTVSFSIEPEVCPPHSYTCETPTNPDWIYKRSDALNCTEKSTYWAYCSLCGINASEDPNTDLTDSTMYYEGEAGAHHYAEIVDDKYFVAGTGADCQHFKQFYKACIDCGEKHATEIWTSTLNGDHNFVEGLKDAVPTTHTKDTLADGMQAHYFCDECDTYFTEGKVATTKEALVIKAEHVYSNEFGYKGADGHADTCGVCGHYDHLYEHQYTDPADTDCNYCGFIREVKIALKGDVTGDGIINMEDAAALQRHVLKIEIIEDAEVLAVANVNGDAYINMEDAANIMRYALKIIDTFE